jgi:hypothetical protein
MKNLDDIKDASINFKKITLRSELSYRGGVIEIDLTTLGFRGEKMLAYQNYLGGGLLGKVCSNNTIQANHKSITDKKLAKLESITEEFKEYLHNITNPETFWEKQSYFKNQTMPTSAY